MKGNRKIKQTTVLLIAYVLVVGFVGAGGQVYGEEETNDSNIEVDVQSVEATVDIDSFTITIAEDTDPTTYTIIENEEAATEQDYGQSLDPENVGEMTIGVTAKSDSGMDFVDNVEVTIEAELGDSGVAKYQWTYTFDEWTGSETEETQTYTFEQDEDGVDFTPFLRYGDYSIHAELTDDDDNTNEDTYDSDHNGAPFFAETTITVIADDADSATAEPGQTVRDRNDDNSDLDLGSPEINITINSDWKLSMEDIELTGDIGEDITGDGSYGDPEGGYDSDNEEISGTAVDGEVQEINYEISIPEGQYPETYSQDVTHTLTNTDA